MTHSSQFRSKACWDVGYKLLSVLDQPDDEFTCFELSKRLNMNHQIVNSRVKKLLNDGAVIRTFYCRDVANKNLNPSRYRISNEFKRFLERFPEYVEAAT